MTHLIGLTAISSKHITSLSKWSKQLNVPIAENPQHYRYLLCFLETHIEIQSVQSNMKPLSIDFTTAHIKQRLHKRRLLQETLIKAIGKKAKFVLDATLGLGRDALKLAACGYCVTALERSPILFTLVQNAIERAQKDPDIRPMLQRLQILNLDACAFFAHPLDPPDVIYLDPMHPPRKKKSALVKKEMRIIRDLVGEDQDAETVLASARTIAKQRVVIKLPMYVPPLGAQTPDISFSGKTTRYDIYLSGFNSSR